MGIFSIFKKDKELMERANEVLPNDKYNIIKYFLKVNESTDAAGVGIIIVDENDNIVNEYGSRSDGHAFVERQMMDLPDDEDPHLYGFYLADNGFLEIKLSSSVSGVFVPENPTPKQLEVLNDFYECCKLYADLPNTIYHISVAAYCPSYKCESSWDGLNQLEEICNNFSEVKNR